MADTKGDEGRDVNPKHAARAIDAIARHICTADWTDGFCVVRDGKCTQNPDPTHWRNCVTRAKGCVNAMATRGINPVWVFDKIALIPTDTASGR